MTIQPPSRTVAEPERVRVFGQLAAFFNAGMLMERALATLESDHPVANESLQVARQRVRNGHSFAAAAKAARMVSPFDDALISAAEDAGRLGPSSLVSAIGTSQGWPGHARLEVASCSPHWY